MIEQITLGQISLAVGFLVALFGGLTAIASGIKKYLTVIIKVELDPITESIEGINAKIDETNSKIDKVDMEATKNFLVRYLADAEQGNLIDEIERERFWEQYAHYIDKGGNSYIKQKVEKLKEKGVL